MNSVGSHLLEVSGVVRFTEMVDGGRWGLEEGVGSWCVVGTEFQFGKTSTF